MTGQEVHLGANDNGESGNAPDNTIVSIRAIQ